MTREEIKAKEATENIYAIFMDANTLNDMGDVYFPEEEIMNYLKEIL